MPTIFRMNGFRFFFYSNEGNEPPHIHVEKGDGSGKYWLQPIEKGYTVGFTGREERQIKEIVENNCELFIQKWNDFFGN